MGIEPLISRSTQHLPEQTRLSDPGVATDDNDLAAGASPACAQYSAELLELQAAPDEWRAHQSVLATERTQRPYGNGLAKTFDLQLAECVEACAIGKPSVDMIGDQRLSRLRHRHQARRQIDRIAE